MKKEKTIQEEHSALSRKLTYNDGLEFASKLTQGDFAKAVFESTVTRTIMEMLGYKEFIAEVRSKSGKEDNMLDFASFADTCTPFSFPVIFHCQGHPIKAALIGFRS